MCVCVCWSVTMVVCKVWRRPCLLKCDRGRMYIWQRPCLSKCDGGQAVIYKPSECLLWSLLWNLLHSLGINNFVAVPRTCVLTYTANYLPLTKRTRNTGKQPRITQRTATSHTTETATSHTTNLLISSYATQKKLGGKQLCNRKGTCS